MPSTLGGLVRWVLATVIMVGIGIAIINRVPIIAGIVYPKAA